jgi:hypothetical protein
MYSLQKRTCIAAMLALKRDIGGIARIHKVTGRCSLVSCQKAGLAPGVTSRFCAADDSAACSAAASRTSISLKVKNAISGYGPGRREQDFKATDRLAYRALTRAINSTQAHFVVIKSGKSARVFFLKCLSSYITNVRVHGTATVCCCCPCLQ